MNTGRRERAVNPVTAIVDIVAYCLTFIALAALVLCYLAPYVNPNHIWWFSFFGLAAPGIYLGNVILMLYWTLRWRRIAAGMLLLLLLGIGNVTKFYRPVWSKQYQEFVPDQHSLRIMTYNVDGFRGTDVGMPENRLPQIARYVREVDPDIICFQEYEMNHVIPAATVDAAFSEWPYKRVGYVLGGGEHDNYGWGLAIYSKYPIAGGRNLVFPESTNSSMWADIVVRRDTVRVYNNHLQTTQVNVEDREFIGYEAFSDTLLNDKATGIARKLKRNFQIRATQADTVAGYIHDGRSRVIVCGDFNDTPMSYAYRTMLGGFTDAFRRKGEGMVATYKGLYNLFRIDYIFHSGDLGTAAYRSDVQQWSDHNPVVVDIILKNK